jgi:hypothetical protein
VDVGAGTLSVATHTESSGQRFDADWLVWVTTSNHIN